MTLHSEIARTVAKEIKVTLTPQEETRLAGDCAVNPAANEAYFRSRYFLDRRTKADLDEALVSAQQAIELDPTFAPAYASLSEVYLTLGLYEPTRETELLAKAQAASLRALELDDSLTKRSSLHPGCHSWHWLGLVWGRSRVLAGYRTQSQQCLRTPLVFGPLNYLRPSD